MVLLIYVSPIVYGGSVLVFDLVCTTLCPFKFCNDLDEKERALLLLSFRCLVSVYVLWLFFTVSWVGIQVVIVVFPDHTHLFMTKFILSIRLFRSENVRFLSHIKLTLSLFKVCSINSVVFSSLIK